MFLHRKVAKHKATNSFQINSFNTIPVEISSVQFSHSVMSDSVTPWTAVHQASLSIAIFRSLLKLMSIKSVMPSNHLILCCPVEIAVEFLN